jgi:hypothetical protein
MRIKQSEHKQRTNLNDTLSFTSCYWYVQAISIIVPIGSENDSNYIRPDCILK